MIFCERNRPSSVLKPPHGPTTRTPCPLRPFSRLRAALPVLPNGRPRPIAPVPGNVPSQSILIGSRPELSNVRCPSWRARRGLRWEAAASVRREAKRSNRSGYHMPSTARRRGGAGRGFCVTWDDSSLLDEHLLRSDNSFAGASSTTRQSKRMERKPGRDGARLRRDVRAQALSEMPRGYATAGARVGDVLAAQLDDANIGARSTCPRPAGCRARATRTRWRLRAVNA